MPFYTHVLLVTDLREDCSVVVERAKRLLVQNPSAKLSALHVVEETILSAGYEIVPIVPAVNEGELVANAREKMVALLAAHEIDSANVSIETALSTRRGILDYVTKNQPDVIVIGRHTRTGLASLLGATADEILPTVSCDVLVVKLGAPV